MAETEKVMSAADVWQGDLLAFARALLQEYTKLCAAVEPLGEPGRLSPVQGAHVGDRLCVRVQHPSPRTITMTLATPESAAYANELLADPSSGWKLVDAAGSSPDAVKVEKPNTYESMNGAVKESDE